MPAVFCEVVANANPELSDFRHTMDDLNRLLHLNSGFIPVNVRQRVREYFHQTKHIQVASAGTRVIDQLSPELQGEVVLLINQHWIKKIWFLKDVEVGCVVQVRPPPREPHGPTCTESSADAAGTRTPPVIDACRSIASSRRVQVAMSMSALVFAPSETPPPTTLFVINRGAVLYCGKVIASCPSP